MSREKTLSAKVEFKLKPFRVPGFVLLNTEQAMNEADEVVTKLSLSDISPEDLDSLCSRFRRDVFDKAGKRPPSINNAIG